MAMNTANTFLFYDATGTGTFTKLVDIMNYPDMGSSPSKLDTTDLSQSKFKTNILGLQEAPDLVFEANYDETVYQLISTITETKKYQLQFGVAGVDGIFDWEGDISIYVMGAGVDEVRKMQITISTSTPIVQS